MQSIPAAVQLPVFEVEANQITVIQSPRDFYKTIIDGIRLSKNRIVLASLYIGTTEKEIVDELQKKLSESSTVQVSILLDYFRGTRVDQFGNSSYSMLRGLSHKYPERVSLSFYHSPNVGRATKSIVPQRFIEGFGLQHMKIYGFDDQVIISGYMNLIRANLNQDYFENRQDRYVMINNHHVSNYFSDLVRVISGFSFKSVCTGLVPPSLFCTRRWTANKSFKNEFHQGLLNFTSRWFESTTEARQSLENGMKDTKAYIAPTIQLYPLSMRQDEKTIIKVIELGHLNPQYEFHILAGYFNLPRALTHPIMTSTAKYHLITSAPQANGFYGSKGVSRFIPDAYSYLEYLFLEKVAKYKRESAVQMYEYKRNGWTWHCKGIWMKSNTEEFLTMVGSSNMNYRSLRRDLESQVLLMTKNRTLRESFESNLSFLYKDTGSVDLNSFSQRQFPYVLKFVTKTIRNML